MTISEKQKLIVRLCAGILDVPNPNEGTHVDELSMAIVALRANAAHIFTIVHGRPAMTEDEDHG